MNARQPGKERSVAAAYAISRESAARRTDPAYLALAGLAECHRVLGRTLVVIAETSYIGRLGVESLAARALMLPCVMLTMSMSHAAMGGGVSSAIARALGAGDRDRAESLATHALLIAVLFGLVFMLDMLAGGPRLLELLGGRGNVLAQAIAYSHIYFGGAVLIWLVNILASILRDTGNMKLPSLMIVNSAIGQNILGRTLGLGLGLLNLTMVCPYTTKSRKAETSAEARQEHSET